MTFLLMNLDLFLKFREKILSHINMYYISVGDYKLQFMFGNYKAPTKTRRDIVLTYFWLMKSYIDDKAKFDPLNGQIFIYKSLL